VKSKQLTIILGVVAVLLLAPAGYLAVAKSSPQSYEECIKAGGELTNVKFTIVAGGQLPDFDSICRYKGKTFKNSLTGKKGTANPNNNVQSQDPAATPGSPQPQALKRICPDAWYDNQMPGVADQETRPDEYLIVNGRRAELTDYDVEWIKSHCRINKPTTVY
jgi:hypothetical protein